MKNKSKDPKQESEKSRLGRALAEAKRRTESVEDLEHDDDIVVAMACKRAHENWPEILKTLEGAVNDYFKGEGPQSIEVRFKIAFHGRDGMVWAAAYEGAIRALLPEGFTAEDDRTVCFPESSAFSINW